MRILFLAMIMIVHPALVNAASQLKAESIAIPGGEAGIGFDDMVYSPELHKVLVPAGHTGKVHMIDCATYAMTSIGGFSSSAKLQKGHKVGVSSADEGEGHLFVADHGTHQLVAIDLKSGKAVASANLAGDADYVRYTGFNHEIWLTEPHNKQIEVISFIAGERPLLKRAFVIPVLTGPESLVIDHLWGRAYTNLGPQAAVIDLATHKIVGLWLNGCQKSRGDAIDEEKGYLFVACGEGQAVVFDIKHNHKMISEIPADPGPDVISYNAKLSHLYLTSSKKATLSVIGVSPQGQLSLLSLGLAGNRSHCVVSDDQNNIWVCDPPHGRLLHYKDTL